MQGNSVATGGYSEMQAVGMAVVVLAVGVTVGLATLGVSGGFLGVAFVGVFAVLMVLAWPLFERAHPRSDAAERE